MTSNLGMLIPKDDTPSDKHDWATVTDDDPLRIQLDSDSVPLPFTPDTMVGGLVVNDRVLVLLMTNNSPTFKGRRVVILGKPQ